MNPQDVWQSVLGEIQLQISKPSFLTWFKNSQLVEKKEKEGMAVVGLPNNFAKEWIKNRYHKIILRSLRNIDSSIKNINYIVIGQNQQITALYKKPTVIEENYQLNLNDAKVDPKTNLNPRYGFQSFIVGSFNELAFAASQAVIKNIGKKYNPFFIYGGVGLGKTHLLQATGNAIKEEYKNKINILYTTSEKYINDVVGAIRNHQMEDIKKKYRGVDVLIIDDIQFIGGKAATEMEFFNTFNALYEYNKQIIISSDRPPAAIPTLQERLRSRFEGGMIADITYPDYETRLAILKTKTQNQRTFLDDKILEYIAAKIQRNIRELEGVVNKVIFYEQYKNEKINTKKLDEIISEITQVSEKNITANDIIKVVADFFNISPNDIINKGRKKEVVEPRQIAIYLLRDVLKLSYPTIGEKIGKRDHTTAIHSYEKINKIINRDPSLNQKIMVIKEELYRN